MKKKKPKIKTVNGQSYLTIPSPEEDTCTGCAGQEDSDACDALGDICGDPYTDIIWIKVPTIITKRRKKRA
jgi:hypothetical protein